MRDQCPWKDNDGKRCQWDVHSGNVHNILGLPGVPTVPTPVSYSSPVTDRREGAPRGV